MALSLVTRLMIFSVRGPLLQLLCSSPLHFLTRSKEQWGFLSLLYADIILPDHQ